MRIKATNVPEAYSKLIGQIDRANVCASSENFNPSHHWVEGGWHELINVCVEIENPLERVVALRSDPIAFVPYLALQWAWYAWGRQNTELKRYFPQMWERAQEGDVNSNYGQYVWVERQFEHCLNLLRKDPSSRRAVIMFNRRDVSMSRTCDHICTTSLQFLVRHDRLNLITTMRSNELHFGFRTDVVFFTMLQEMMATFLGVGVGTYFHNVGSLHIQYENLNFEHATLIEWPRFHPDELSDLIQLRHFFDEEFTFFSPFELSKHLYKDLLFFKS
jgi:thymidylate synthase